tara:strand:+ start:7329 stop:8333 length:1005 start_codon:yes stop_codon:yes gene_type:complete
MFKNIDPSNKSIKPYKVYKDFTLTHNQSASGYVVLRADGSSTFNFVTSSAASQSFGTYNGTTKKYSLGTYYDIPNWNLVNKLYYKDADKPYQSFGSNQNKKQKRQLHNTARIFSIPQELFGEKIKPNSIELEDTSNGKTFLIKDDGDGNLYDNAFSASFAAYKSGGFTQFPTNGSGSQVGNVFYEHGVMVVTDTGSYYNCGLGTGHELKYKATHTNYEYEYMVNVGVGEYNSSVNKSVTFEGSGSRTLPEGTLNISKFMPPGDEPDSNGIGTFKSFYNATSKYEGFTTHSLFKPYVTTIGLYNDDNELLVVGKLAKAIKLSDDYEMNFIVRFDI